MTALDVTSTMPAGVVVVGEVRATPASIYPDGFAQSLMRKMEYQPDGCLTWMGATDRGYGKVNRFGKNYRVHRAFYECVVGPVPAGMTLDHLCRVRRCANPHHLEVVSQKENLRRGAGCGGLLHALAAPADRR